MAYEDEVKEMRKLLDKLKEIGPLTWDDLLTADPSTWSEEVRRAHLLVIEAAQRRLKRGKGR